MTHSDRNRASAARIPGKGTGFAVGALTIAWSGLIALSGCGRAPDRAPSAPAPAARPHTGAAASPAESLLPPIDLPKADQRLGTAVVVVVDTSGSMSQKVDGPDKTRQHKNEVAQAALRRIIDVTEGWRQKHVDSPLFMGILSFSSHCTTVLPVGPFDAAEATAAVSKIPHPAGGTAIGRALEEAFKALYASGCVRKHVVCITDGENTVSTPPNLMARQLFSQTKGEVQIHFVAFDTSARHFDFLKDVNGSVVEAADGAELQVCLVDLYERRILVEAMPAERE
jgi:hypothetical protein